MSTQIRDRGATLKVSGGGGGGLTSDSKWGVVKTPFLSSS